MISELLASTLHPLIAGQAFAPIRFKMNVTTELESRHILLKALLLENLAGVGRFRIVAFPRRDVYIRNPNHFWIPARKDAHLPRPRESSPIAAHRALTRAFSPNL